MKRFLCSLVVLAGLSSFAAAPLLAADANPTPMPVQASAPAASTDAPAAAPSARNHDRSSRANRDKTSKHHQCRESGARRNRDRT